MAADVLTLLTSSATSLKVDATPLVLRRALPTLCVSCFGNTLAQTVQQQKAKPPTIHVIIPKMQGPPAKTISQLLAGIKRVDEPQLQAMSETAAEVLGGLKKALNADEKKNESA